MKGRTPQVPASLLWCWVVVLQFDSVGLLLLPPGPPGRGRGACCGVTWGRVHVESV